MSDRFCPQCRVEVEDAGGFCLLGHPLHEVAPVASLAELRAEVDMAFEQARVQVATAVGESGPPPPPPPALISLEVGEDVLSGPDPIADFAPAPRMDWGPERRQGRLRRLG